MRTKPDRRWIAICLKDDGSARRKRVDAPTWFLARMRAAVELHVDPDDITVRPQVGA